MARSESKKVAIDSSVFIARVTGDRPEHAAGLAALFHEVDLQKVKLFGSTLLYTEVLGGGFNEPADPVKDQLIFDILDNPAVLTMVQVTRQVAVVARELRRDRRLKPADAIHLATAIFAGAEVFVTLDHGFRPGSSAHGVAISLPGSAFGEDVLPI